MFEIGGGILGLILLILVIWAIIKTLSSGADTATKLLWTLVLIFLPLLGLILWFFLGPRGTANL